ncbi:MAG: 3-(cis-5,6-dihydroxycyclohexa-1,3-dien-1-yl)propanoate dehydrogenase [Pseudomonadales bacterium]|nr:3-(cis-5,6-dihydroxycyclohexa-1,3-dien-1-yl)propanoate dehydrogenase [Pseudomonadales bacterium]
MRLQDQAVILTGGASGLGLAILERFVEEGAKVAVLDRSDAGCDAIASRFGDAVTTFVGDVRSQSDNEAIVARCIERFGKVDCAIGNAGIWDFNLPLVDLPADKLGESFDEMFGINVLGYIALAKAAMKPLVAASGSMIFTVSNAGFLPAGGGVLYTATKHAVVGMIRQLAYELAPHVRVNGVAPGPISTQLTGPQSLAMENRTIPGARFEAGASGFVPIGRMPTPEEYAGAYVFFASRQDNVPATGTILNHDGGFGVRGLGPVPRGGDDLRDKLEL